MGGLAVVKSNFILLCKKSLKHRKLGRVVQSRVKINRVRAKFEFRFESLKSKFSFILFTYNLMIGCSKKNRENYPGKCF